MRVHPAQDSPLGVVRNRRKDGTLTPCTRAGGSRRPNGRQSIFECSVVISGPRAISGELDVGTAPTVGIVLSDPDITDLDLGEITFIDAAGLRVLLTANRQRSARLGLLSVSRPVQRLFELTGHLATFRWATGQLSFRIGPIGPILKDRTGADPTTYCRRHAQPDVGEHRGQGQRAVPRGDDVRGRWATATTTTAWRSSTAPSTPGSTSSTPPTCTRAASPRRSSARRSPAGATTSCWRRSSTGRWARDRTCPATAGDGSSARSRTRCAGSAPTGSTSTRSTGPTRATDIEDTLSALDDLVHAGKIRYAGCSTFPAELIVEAHWAAERRGLEPFRTEQPPYSIFARRIENGPAADVRALRNGRARVEPAERRLADRPLRQWRRRAAPARMERMPQRFDLDATGQPAQARARRRARQAGSRRRHRHASAWPSASCSPTRP